MENVDSRLWRRIGLVGFLATGVVGLSAVGALNTHSQGGRWLLKAGHGILGRAQKAEAAEALHGRHGYHIKSRGGGTVICRSERGQQRYLGSIRGERGRGGEGGFKDDDGRASRHQGMFPRPYHLAERVEGDPRGLVSGSGTENRSRGEIDD